MRKIIIIIVIAIPVLILLTSVTVTCIKKYCDKADATRLYKEGLKPIDDKDNPFYPKAALSFFDSLLKIPHSPYQAEKSNWRDPRFY